MTLKRNLNVLLNKKCVSKQRINEMKSRKYKWNRAAINCEKRARVDVCNANVNGSLVVCGICLLRCCLIKSKRNREKCNHHYECVHLHNNSVQTQKKTGRQEQHAKSFHCLLHSFHFPAIKCDECHRMASIWDVRCVWATLRFVFMSKAHFLWLCSCRFFLSLSLYSHFFCFGHV